MGYSLGWNNPLIRSPLILTSCPGHPSTSRGTKISPKIAAEVPFPSSHWVSSTPRRCLWNCVKWATWTSKLTAKVSEGSGKKQNKKKKRAKMSWQSKGTPPPKASPPPRNKAIFWGVYLRFPWKNGLDGSTGMFFCGISSKKLAKEIHRLGLGAFQAKGCKQPLIINFPCFRHDKGVSKNRDTPKCMMYNGKPY